MRVLVSGGTGYVGSALVRQLVKRGDAVAVLSRQTLHDSDGTTNVQYTDIQGLAAFCIAWRPDAIVHLAASLQKGIDFSSVESLTSANIVLPLHLASAANASGPCKFVNISTFSTSVDGQTYFPQTLYAATKRACEDLLAYYHQSEALKVCSLCFYDVYGSNQPHDRFLNSLIKAVIESKPFSMSRGDQEICFLHVDDAVSAILYTLGTAMCFEKRDENIYSVFGPDIYRLKELPEKISTLLARTAIPLLHDKPYRKNEIMKFAPRYPLLPGWQAAASFDDAIKDIVLTEKNK